MATYRAIASFYDDEYADLEMLHHDVGWLISRLPKRRADVLMLACGTGRAAIPVAQSGHRVVGIDIDAAMLAIAREKAESQDVPKDRITFEEGDLLQFSHSRKFDVATILFNSFLMFTTTQQQDRVLANAHRALKAGGRLFIDVFNPDLARIADDESLKADVRLFFSHHLGVGVQRVTHIRATHVPQVRETTFEYRWFDAKGRRKKRVVRFDLTYLFPRELTLLLERNGFQVEAMHGDYDGGEVNAESERISVEARRI